MNKELEEAIKYLKIIKDTDLLKAGYVYGTEAIETVLNYIENSIPKQTLIEKIRERQFELQQEYKEFKDDIKLNTLQDLLEGVENK